MYKQFQAVYYLPENIPALIEMEKRNSIYESRIYYGNISFLTEVGVFEVEPFLTNPARLPEKFKKDVTRIHKVGYVFAPVFPGDPRKGDDIKPFLEEVEELIDSGLIWANEE